MNQVKFSKFHGFGNDYIVILAENLTSIEDLSEFSKRICHRNTGVGGDGIAVLRRLETGADYECRIINPDGSEAGFSGNGTRCAVAFLYYANLFSAENLKLSTKSGVKNYQFLKRDENTFWFLAELGKPKFGLPSAESVREYAGANNLQMSKTSNFMIPREDLILEFVAVDVGNPVACVFVEDFEKLDWRRIGSLMETNTAMFPDRTNVVFVKIIDRENIEIRIWERGAGETSSSGTCSIAAAVACHYVEKADRKVFVHAEGGTTETVWREDGEMMITGRADLAFTGEYFLPELPFGSGNKFRD